MKFRVVCYLVNITKIQLTASAELGVPKTIRNLYPNR